MLSRGIEDLANYFLSYKEAAAYKHVQQLLAAQPHKIQHPYQTHWLSLHAVVERPILSSTLPSWPSSKAMVMCTAS
ncbi:hypothetical protein HPB49_026272 [Dermacentor silvarum]|nr:hypothetical protein HPB49_026272 [Dermacentor silvarum]